MSFTWTEEKIKFYKDASRYTGFHRQVGEIIRPYLDENWTLCDLGCGLGLIDFEISPYVNRITAIDLSDLAISDYRKRLEASSIENISVESGDSDEVKGRLWDAVLLSFFGKPGEELDRIFSMAEKEAILITYVDPLSEKHGQLKKNHNRPTTSDYEAHIKNKGYKYEIIYKDMDFGQPFRSLEEAGLYHESYSRETDPDKRTQLIRKNLKDVESTGDKEFPYFLSKKKGIGIIVVKL